MPNEANCAMFICVHIVDAKKAAVNSYPQVETKYIDTMIRSY